MDNFEFKGTNGPWYLPHLSDDSCQCNCTFVLNDSLFGSVADINYSKEGDDWMLGDHPPIEQAKYNGLLIAMAPEMLNAMKSVFDIVSSNTPYEYVNAISILSETLKRATDIEYYLKTRSQYD